MVAELALESLLLCMTPSHALTQLQVEKLALPPTVLSAIESGNEADITQALQTLTKDSSPPPHRVLTSCYRLAVFTPALHRALLTFFASCSLVPGMFKAVRHVFKIAELRIAHEMFALLTHRFETTRHFDRAGWNHAFVPGEGYISVAKEVARSVERCRGRQHDRGHLHARLAHCGAARSQ